jgi:hypothetical protein
LSQIRISFLAAGFADGKNQKKSRFSSSGLLVMGKEPAYDSPTSKSTSGMPVPFTANSGGYSVSTCLGGKEQLLLYSLEVFAFKNNGPDT